MHRPRSGQYRRNISFAARSSYPTLSACRILRSIRPSGANEIRTGVGGVMGHDGRGGVDGWGAGVGGGGRALVRKPLWTGQLLKARHLHRVGFGLGIRSDLIWRKAAIHFNAPRSATARVCTKPLRYAVYHSMSRAQTEPFRFKPCCFSQQKTTHGLRAAATDLLLGAVVPTREARNKINTVVCRERAQKQKQNKNAGSKQQFSFSFLYFSFNTTSDDTTIGRRSSCALPEEDPYSVDLFYQLQLSR